MNNYFTTNHWLLNNYTIEKGYLRLNKKWLVLAFLLGILSFTSTVQSSAQKVHDYVLIINSYTESTPWSRIFTTPVYKRLIIDEDDTSAYTEHMDVMLMKSESDVENFTSELIHKYTQKPPLLIVLLGNSAYVLLKDSLEKHFGKDIPILVCVEKDYIAPREYYLSKQPCPPDERQNLSDMTIMHKNLTIMYVPEYISETITLMKKCIPDMKELLFLSDKRYISAQNQNSLRKIMQNNFPDIQLKLLTAGDMQTDELIDILQNADAHTGVLYYSWILVQQRGQHSMLSSDTYRMLSAYTNRPIFTLNDMDVVENGMMGGYYYPSSAISSTLFRTIDELLKGKIHDKIITPEKPYPVLNYLLLEKNNIPPTAYPANTILYMKPPTFWEQYSKYVYAGSILFAFLLLVFIFRIKSLNKKRLYQEKELKLLSSYSRLVNNMPIVYLKQRILMDDAGKPIDYIILEVNPEFEKLLCPKEKILQKKGSEIHDQQLTEYLEMCNLVLLQNKKINMQYYFKSTDHYFNVITVSDSTPECINIFMVDITELLKTQQLLRSVNQKLSISLDVANVIPWKWDLVNETIICDVNKAIDATFSGLFNENQLSVPSPQYFAKIHKEDREKVKKAYQLLIDGKIDKVQEEYRIYSPEKGLHSFEWVEARATIDARDEAGHPLSLIGSSLIITERKKIEKELIEAKNKAEESNRLKSAFLANMSHEIRTPLNAIIGFSNILATTDEKEEKKEYISIIENNNTLLLQLISDILDLSKIEAGTLEFIYTNVDLNALLREVEHSMQPRAAENVKIIFEQPQEDCFVSTSKSRLIQVITNLMTNAIKFTQEGSIRFGYTRVNEKMLRFYVSDTGCGIPAEQQKKIFDRFVKLNAFAQGTGLGLSICQMIIDYVEGEMGVESEVGKGTTFWFTFPCTPVILPPKETPVYEKKKIEKDKLCVLIAEDNESNYKLFSSILKRDYTIIHAWNGKEAVELFKQYEPHIILMDINMPEMNGYEATQEIRKISSDIPIIAVTAYAFASDEQQIMISGFDAYTSKPLNAPALKQQMVELLKKRLFLV
ncbi:ATP-binding protein [Parabacteroides pacaensis]|uniref:ATP-binding protein n=1 Tax=Parabacteroides pacaensis TaxID=2086575 RepID=UPI000D0F41A6|nr:ATP-binding protein [Parabacteroides pacaensis]